MTDRESLQNSVRRWRLKFQPWQVRFGRHALLDLMQWQINRREMNFRQFRRIVNCGSFEQARAEARDIVDDELRRIARLPAGPPTQGSRTFPRPTGRGKEQTK